MIVISLVLLFVVPALVQFFYEKNARVFELKSEEVAPILWNEEMSEEYDDLKIIKLKAKSKDETLSNNKINLTNNFYYIPKTNEVFYGIWYSHWNDYAKQDGNNFIITAKNKDGDKFDGIYGITSAGTFDIFEYHSINKVKKVSDINRLTLQLHPIIETPEGPEQGEAIQSEIILEVQKVGTKDDFRSVLD